MSASHMSSRNRPLLATLTLTLSFLTGCGPRVLISTGTTMGLKATPGDGQTRPPQVTLGYRRSEVAIVPTNSDVAIGGKTAPNTDAFSTLASFYFSTQWFGDTELASFIATGHAARKLQKEDSKFSEVFAAGTVKVVAVELEERQVALNSQLTALDETGAQCALRILGKDKKPGKTAKQTLQDAILETSNADEVVQLEAALGRASQGGTACQ